MTASIRPLWIAAALGAAVSAGAPAQTPATDGRWQAWLGCWTPAVRVVPVRSTAAAPLLACVVPAAGTGGVDVATISDTMLVTSDRIEATGERRPFTREGCTGWASAQWSPDGRRVYVRSAYSCAGGLERTVSGLMAIAGNGDWLDVQAVTTGDRTATRVLRYRSTGLPSTLPVQIAGALEGRTSDLGLARTAAAGAITPEDVVEASAQVEPAVVEAWLGERGQGFRLNASRLIALADAGVPSGVIDVMVALSYPRTFTVGSAGVQRAPVQMDGSRIADAYGSAPYGGWDPYGYYSPYGMDPWFRSGMAFGYAGAYGWPYGYGTYGYYPYSPFGYGYGYGYNGWMYGGGVVVVRGTGAVSQPHGRIVKGRGYTQDGSAGSSTAGRGAQPRERTQPSTSGSGSGSAQPRSGGGSSSGSGSSSGRTAHPKPPSR